MADGNVVGSAEFELRATRKKLADDLKQSERDVKGAVDRMEKDAGAAGDRIGNSLGKTARNLTLGITALVAAFSAGLVLAVRFGQASLKMADDLASSARRIGISTTALQEWQYVARKTGEDANAVGAALENFGTKLDQASAGLSKEAGDAFKALGFSQEQLRSFTSVEQALDQVTDRIGELTSASDRAAIAEKLGLGPLATALRDGSDEVARLRDSAAALGFVMDESLIRKGAEAQGQLEDLSQVIGIQMAEAFINLSDEVLAFTQTIANALNGLNSFIGKFDQFKARTEAMYGEGIVDQIAGGNTWQALKGATRSLFSGRTTSAARDIREGNDLLAGSTIDASAVAALAEPNRPRRTPTLSGRTGLTPVHRGGRTDNSAQREAEREARRAERVEQEIYRARQRLLGLADNEFSTAQERLDAQRAALSLDRDARKAELDSRQARKDITAEERRLLDAKEKEVADLEDRLLQDRAWRELEDERIAHERLLSNLTADLVSLQAGSARTAKERLALELELLAITQRQRRDALKTELDRNPNLSASDRQEAMDRLGRVDAAENDATRRRNMGPLDAWRDQSLKTAGEVAEAYENIAARGLDALNDGIVDAIMNSRNLGEVFHNVAKQIGADLLAIGIRKNFTEPLGNMLFGGGSTTSAGSGGGGWFSKIAGWGRGLFGFANGRVGGDGKVHGPGTPTSDSIFALLGQDPVRISRDESIINAEATKKYAPLLRAMNMGLPLPGFAAGLVPSIPGVGPRSHEPMVFDMRGAFVPERFMREVEQKVAAGEARTYGRTMSDAPKLTMSQTAKSQTHTVGRRKR